MPTEQQALVESHSAEAINAAAVAQEANEKSRGVQISSIVRDELQTFFQRGLESGRFIPLKDGKMADVSRFDFICDDIAGLHATQNDMGKDVKELKDNTNSIKNDMWWFKLLGGGFLTLAGLLAAKQLGV